MRKLRALILATMVVCCLVARARAAGDDSSEEYQFTVSPHHAIHGDLTGFGELGYYRNPKAHYDAFTVEYPGVTYLANKWSQFSAGFRTLYTDNENSADKLELRPFAGAKLFLPNGLDWNIYNYTRVEYRDTENRDTKAWTHYTRVRSRFAVEIPLTSRARAWKPKTWYAMADVEPFYRFDKDTVDPVRLRAGIARILSDGVHLELLYNPQFGRASDGDSLELTENIFNLNVRIGLQEGLLRRLQSPGHRY
jgi:Protein of unknown function (DUF2490)